MTHQIKGLIFDYDGTLADSMWLWDKVDRNYIKNHHIETNIDIGQAVRNFSFRECADFFIREFHLTDPPEVIMAEWNAMALHAYGHDILLKDGVREFLEVCKKSGYPMAIVTSNHPENVKANLRLHGLSDYFSPIITADEAGYNKTQPELFSYAANAMHLSPSECVVFDDIYSAISAAKKAGLYTVGVFDARTTEEDTKNMKNAAHRYIRSFQELLEEFHDTITHLPVCEE